MASLLGAQIVFDPSTVTVGGLGGLDCQGGTNPSTITGGVEASGTASFNYDPTTGVLTVTFENTSPSVPNQDTPTLTEIWFNVPRMTVTGITLLSQSGAPAANQTWTLASDVNLEDGMNPLQANCFGDFSVNLNCPGPGPAGGLATIGATALSGNNHIFGPVTFTFQLASTNLAGMNIASFANSFSIMGSQDNANVVMKFQGGGIGGDESGVVANGHGCEPAGWIIGPPQIGTTVYLVQAGYPGCAGCVVVGLSDGPTMHGIYSLPIGDIFGVVSSGVISPGALDITPLAIPNDPSLIGVTVYFLILLNAPGSTLVEIVDSFSMTALP